MGKTLGEGTAGTEDSRDRSSKWPQEHFLPYHGMFHSKELLLIAPAASTPLLHRLLVC